MDLQARYRAKMWSLSRIDRTCISIQHNLACLAMAAAVLRLSPVRRATSSPILRSVCTVRCASGFRVSAMANMATSTPEIEGESESTVNTQYKMATFSDFDKDLSIWAGLS